MLLKLIYNDQIRRPLRGAFLRGSDPGEWLREVCGWGIPADTLECYVVPESIRSVAPVGLFVVFGRQAPDTSAVLQPYGSIGERLFLPLASDIFPALLPQEIERNFVWERQLFHPVIGLVGFGTEDRLDPAALLEFPASPKRDWSRALPGNAPAPPLRNISVLRPPVEHLIQDVTGIGDKSLEEMFGKSSDSGGQSGSGGGIWGALNRALEGFAGQDAGEEESSGFLGKVQGWLKKKADDLEDRRRQELDRLMDLFERDPEAALRYAIPLGGKYRNRGQASPSDTLGPRSPNFDLGSIKGGEAEDFWNVTGYYEKLRQRYLEAANAELAAGKYRRAAYIHAQLLGDLPTAANILEQGKFFREAAAIYREHLNDKPRAARCLEEGGLLLEAIDLYIELKQREKAADLYGVLCQQDKADVLYQTCADLAVQRRDYLDAGRLYRNKMERPEKALEVLWRGWELDQQSERCLDQYLDLYEVLEKGPLGQRLEKIYRTGLPPTREDAFFRILVQRRGQVAGKNAADDRERMNDVALEIMSQQAERGKFDALKRMAHFVTGDRLVEPDTRRYRNWYQNRPRAGGNHETITVGERQSIQLDARVRWHDAVGFRDGFLAIGTRSHGKELYLCRVSWDGYAEKRVLQQNFNWEDCRLIYRYGSEAVYLDLRGNALAEPVVFRPAGDFAGQLLVTNCPGAGDALAGGVMPDGSYRELTNDGPVSMLKRYDYRGVHRDAHPICWHATFQQFQVATYVAERRLHGWRDKVVFASGPFVLHGGHRSGSIGLHCEALDLQEAGEESPTFALAYFPAAGERSVEKSDSPQSRIMAVNPYCKRMQIAVVTEEGDLLVRDAAQMELEGTVAHEWTETKLAVTDLIFLPGDFLLVASEHTVQVYDLKPEYPNLVLAETLEGKIAAVMPTDFRCQIAALLMDGELKVWDFDRY